MENLKKYSFATALAGILFLGMAQISFGQNLITDGDFEDFTTAPPTYGSGLNSASNPNYTGGATLTYWSSTGYNFVFTNGNPGDITIQGADEGFELAGPNADGGSIANGLAVPTGYTGNIVAADPVYETGPITQTVSGLVSGHTYVLTFLYAGAEQYNYNTATTEYWSVSLGSTTNNTATLNTPADGFSGWNTATLYFTATATSETLSFLAGGGPTGEPPFPLLADVSMVAVPEPVATSFWTLLFGMLIIFGKRAWRWYLKKPSTNTS